MSERTELASVFHSVCARMWMIRACLWCLQSERGETPRHCNSSASNGIQLMSKLIEGLTRAGADKAALLVRVCMYTVAMLSVCVHVCVVGLH